MYPIYKYTTLMMRSQSSLSYKYRLIVAGMKVDYYYGWTDGWVDGWMGREIDGLRDREMDEWMVTLSR